MNRTARCGFPEVIFGSGKTAEQVADIMTAMAKAGSSPIIASRIDEEKALSISNLIDKKTKANDGDSKTNIEFHRRANILQYKIHDNDNNNNNSSKQESVPKIAVVSAGTSDLDVAEECAVLLELANTGSVTRVHDVGVAGLHRLLSNLPQIRQCDVVVVFAGMDGALPSVLGGLVSIPVVAVPTSVGYGAAFHGISPLLTMLNTCAPGVTVCNIDNGFGAAVFVHKMLHGHRHKE